MDEFAKPDLTQKEERIRKKIQSMIEYCEYDQSYEGGWMWGERTELYDILSQHDITDESKWKILGHLACPACGNTSFELSSDIGVKSQFDKDVDAHYTKVDKAFRDKVNEFLAVLEKHPMLALNHSLGKRILREIKSKKLPITEVHDEFHRVRIVETAQVFKEKDLYTPPTGKPSEGRFNHAGQSHLYLANAKDAAVKEIAPHKKSFLYWHQIFKITKPIGNILDLTFDWQALTPSTEALLLALHLGGTITKNDRNTKNWKPDYFITRFIMDCAIMAGYKGIKYNSAKGQYKFNLVLFKPNKRIIKALQTPTVEVFRTKKEDWDILDD